MIKTHLAIAVSAVLTAMSFGLPATATAQSTTQIEKIRAKEGLDPQVAKKHLWLAVQDRVTRYFKAEESSEAI